jgi:hypothetical protein
MRHVLRFAFICLVSLLCGCAQVVKAPPVETAPDGTLSMVFGSQQLFHNGVLAPRDSHTIFLDGFLVSHVDLFQGPETLNTNAYVPGKYAFKALAKEDGFFSVMLPPGHYYFVEFGYSGLGLGRGIVGYRSYMPILGNKQHSRSVITLDVLPGRATYIGNLQHHTYDATGGGWSLRLEESDDFAAASEQFVQRYPAWAGLINKNLMHIDPLPN